MSSVSQTVDPVLLRYDNDSQTVVIIPDDNDRFAMSMAETVKVCRIADHFQILRFQEQFRAMLIKLGAWSSAHKEKISRSMVSTRDAGILFLVCTRIPGFDQELENELADLDLEIAGDEDLDLIRLSVMAIPSDTDEAVYCFADRDNNLVYAK